MSEFRALGKRVTEFEGFDTFEVDGEVSQIELVTDELTTQCPVTGQPDFYELQVIFQPDRLAIETKTFKLYIMSFRDEQAFAEALAARIARDIKAATDCKQVRVLLKQQTRGGIRLSVTAAIPSASEMGVE